MELKKVQSIEASGWLLKGEYTNTNLNWQCDFILFSFFFLMSIPIVGGLKPKGDPNGLDQYPFYKVTMT